MSLRVPSQSKRRGYGLNDAVNCLEAFTGDGVILSDLEANVNVYERGHHFEISRVILNRHV